MLFLKMEGEGEVSTPVQEYSKLDEIFEDIDIYFFETFLSFVPVHELNRIFKTLEIQGIDLYNVQRSLFYYFFQTKPLNFWILFPSVSPTNISMNML